MANIQQNERWQELSDGRVVKFGVVCAGCAHEDTASDVNPCSACKRGTKDARHVDQYCARAH